MKPQSLQDAIKEQALRKEKARQSGGWKEPVIKQHKVSAEDLVRSPSRMAQSPIAMPPIYSSAVMPTTTNNTEINSIKKIIEQMKKDLLIQKNEIAVLRQENVALRNDLNAVMSSEKENSKVKVPASLEPHSAKDLEESQRLDKALRNFMKTKEGLFDSKHMSIRDEQGCNIICFRKKIYIPDKLRSKTIQYYKRLHHTDSEALTALRKNCCWLDLEKDFYDPSKY